MPKLVFEQIQFVGLNDLDAEEQYTVQKLSAEYYQKIKRGLKNDLTLLVHIKCYDKGGKRKKYCIHVRCLSPIKKTIESCRAHEWDLPRAVHKAFTDIQNQVRHTFKSDTSRRK